MKNYCNYPPKSIYLRIKSTTIPMKTLNRLKIVLVEQNKTGKWLAESLGKNEATVSRWCTNDMQPSLETFAQIATILNVDIRELITPTKKDNE